MLALSLLAAAIAPAAVLAAGPSFGTPSVTAELGQPLTFTSTIDGDNIQSVDVLIHLDGNPTTVIVSSNTQINNIYQAQASIDIASSADCACLAQGTTAPNTHFDYQFRVTNSDGGTSVGPVAQGVYQDNRFQWQTLTQDQVVVHWYAGDQTFGASAATVANGAIDKASQLLGVTLDKPVDLFVYNTEDDMRSAISPDRENVAGEAHPDIDTMYVWIPSDQGAEAFAGTLIRHELTHLVFHRAGSTKARRSTCRRATRLTGRALSTTPWPTRRSFRSTAFPACSHLSSRSSTWLTARRLPLSTSSSARTAIRRSGTWSRAMPTASLTTRRSQRQQAQTSRHSTPHGSSHWG
jgi:hypothetical protein